MQSRRFTGVAGDYHPSSPLAASDHTSPQRATSTLTYPMIPKRPLDTHTQVYLADLVRRLLAHLDRKREQRGLGAGSLWSVAKLARKCGMGYKRMRRLIVERTSPITMGDFDNLLHAEGLSILDLIEPTELAASYTRFERQDQYKIRTIAGGVQARNSKVIKDLETNVQTSTNDTLQIP